MAIYLIQHRWTHRELAAIEAPSYTRALEWAARRGMSLMDVDLVGIDLRGAFLAGADLRGAGLAAADLAGCYLRCADLRDAKLAYAFLGSADFRRADLRDAELSRADLRGANLVGADLRGAVLNGARLGGALCDWRWSGIPAELLRQRQGESAGDSRLVVALAFHDDRAPWSWLKLLAGRGTVTDWALGVLADWVRDGDNAPEMLRSLVADVATGRDGSAAADASTRRHADAAVPATRRAAATGRRPRESADGTTDSPEIW